MRQLQGGFHYVQGDGDRIRERIEYYLLNGELDKLSDFSHALTKAIDTLKSLAVKLMEAKVIMAGGDDVLFLIESAKYQREHVEQLAGCYKSLTGNTISFGVGETAEAAYLNLRRAKSIGSGRIVENEV